MARNRRPSRARPIYSLRISESERALMESAAADRGEYLAEFLRRVGLQAARQHLNQS